MKVFSYGSNMLTLRLQAENRAPNAVKSAVGYVLGRKLIFEKLSTKDQSGKCNAKRTGARTDRVYGVVFDVPIDEIPSLRRAEGLHHGYREESVRVTLRGGRQIRARAFIAEENAVFATLVPHKWYYDLVCAGAEQHRLPAGYVARLRSAKRQQDPLPRREDKLEAERVLRKYRAAS